MYYGVFNFVIYIVTLLITLVLIKDNNACIYIVRFSKKHILQQVFTGLALAFMLIFPLAIINIVLFHSFSAFQFLKLAICARINFFTFQLLVAVTEEFLFRGYLLCIFTRMTKSSTGAILCTAALFAGIHFVFNQDLVQFVIALIVGFLFAFIFVKNTNCSIYSLILAHLLYDLAISNVY
ncbi:hypothetical protein OBV_21680 [Oscillibacter valericigenes Sjm18-20]|nr:hypothetical protein OBV_21680 [Oscillibacter valericigenes Sjm18-20]